MKERRATIKIAKNAQMIVRCNTCPISPHLLGMNQRTACLAGKVKITNGSNEFVPEKICDWYVRGSIKKLDNGRNFISCKQE